MGKSLPTSPLGKRFALGTSLILLPMIFCLGVIYWLHRDVVTAFEEVQEETTQEILSVSNLQRRLLEAAMPVNDYLIQENGLLNLKIAASTPFGNHTQSMGVHKDWPGLASIISKTFAQMPQSKHLEIKRKWGALDIHQIDEQEVFGPTKFLLQSLAAIFIAMAAVALIVWMKRGRPKHLAIREVHFLVSFSFAGLIISIGAFVVMLQKSDRVLDEARIRNQQSFDLALELKQSSDDLTRFARTYAVTGDLKYEQYFRAIIAIRDGKQAHPREFTRSYWDHVAAGRVAPDQGGELYSIEQRMIDLGISEKERAKLAEAKRVSDELVNLENVAMNAVKGLYQDDEGRFARTGEPNLAMASRLLHGQEYHAAKSRIMEQIDQFFILMERRTSHQLRREEARNHALLLGITILTLITIGFSFYVFFLLRRRVILPLGKLETGAKTIEDGGFDHHIEHLSDDEIGSLAKAFNSMTCSIKEHIKNLHAEINERLSVEEDLRKAKKGAEEANQAKSDFLANMSHELRTPLNSVVGFSEVLVDQLFGPLNEKQQGYIENILTSGRHLLGLIDDILDLSKVEAGKMELELGRFPLQGVMDSSLALLREKALKHNINLSLELEPEADVEIEADQRKCKQMMFNLLSNALKFTPDGGSVSVQARKVSPTEAQTGGDWVEISVADTGIGIKPEDMSKLFKEFSQLESHHTKQYEGTGLGLALTRKFVELHGGRIWAESEFGKGSRFTFALPLRHPVGKTD